MPHPLVPSPPLLHHEAITSLVAFLQSPSKHSFQCLELSLIIFSAVW